MDKQLFVTEGSIGRAVVLAKTIGGAQSFMRKRYGSLGGPYHSRRATQEDLREHLRGGAVFFDAQAETSMPRDEAYALAGLTPPS